MARNDNQNLTEVSRLSSASQMTGTLISASDIRIDGSFEGKIITAGKVVIGQTSTFKGDIISLSADIWGKLEGNVLVGDTLSVKSGGTVTGGIEAVRLSVELDSKLNGTCRMITREVFDKAVSQVSALKPKEKQ